MSYPERWILVSIRGKYLLIVENKQVREFTAFPTEEEVETAIAMSRVLFK